jgi:hypothetical protein
MPRHLALVHPAAQRAEQRRQEGEGGQHHHDDVEAGDQAERAHVRNAHESQGAHGQANRDAGEEHRRTRGRHGPTDSRFGITSFEQPLPVATEDEQRVVDADTQAQHRSQDGRDHADLEVVLEDDGDRRRRPDAEEGDADRNEHRHDGPERDQQDHDGEGETDVVGVVRKRRLRRVERVRDLTSDHRLHTRLSRRRDRLLQVVPEVRVLVGRSRQLCTAVAQLQPEVGDRRIGRRDSAGDLRELDRREVQPVRHHRFDTCHLADVRDRSIDRRRVGRIGDASGLRLEHQRCGGAGERGEVGVQEVRGRLGLGTRDGEVVGGVRLHDVGERADREGDHNPYADAPPVVPGREPAETLEHRVPVGIGRRQMRPPCPERRG